MKEKQIVYLRQSGGDVRKQMFSSAFAQMIAEKTICESPSGVSFSEIKESILKICGQETFNNGALWDFLRHRYRCTFDSELFIPTKEQRCRMGEVERFTHAYQNFLAKSKDTLIDIVSSSLRTNRQSTVYVCAAISASQALTFSEKNYPNDWYTAQFYKYLTCCHARDLDQALCNLSEENQKLEIGLFIKNPLALEAFVASDMKCLSDLLSISPGVVSDAIFLDFTFCLNIIRGLSGDPTVKLKEYLDNELRELSDKERKILFLKRGIGPDNDSHTLEEVGTDYHVTRERIRQILVKCERKVSSWGLCQPLLLAYLVKRFGNFHYVSYEDVCAGLGKKYTDLLALNALNIDSPNLAFDSELKVFYQPSEIDVDTIIERETSELNEFCWPDEINAFPPLRRRAALHKFSLRQNGLYLRIGMTEMDLVLKVLDETFPNGYRQWNIDDYGKLKVAVLKRFGDSFPMPSFVSIRGALPRKGFVDVDKGKCKRQTFLKQSISDELVQQIEDYLEEHKPAVFYQAILERFSNELNKAGITNYYFLKSLLDEKLDRSSFKPERNYIKVGSNLSSREARQSWLNSTTGVFTLQDVRNAFPGTKDYVLLDSINHNPNLITLDTYIYVLAPFVGVSEQANRVIDEEIKKTFSALNERVISAKKVFSRIRFLHPEVLHMMGRIQNSYSLFSYSRWAFSKDYFFRRPYIALSEEDLVGTDQILIFHLETLDGFDKRTVDEYTLKMNLHPKNIYLDLLDDLSDEFVQTGRTSTVRKNLLNLNPLMLSDMRQTLSLLVKTLGRINGETFTGYHMFPRIPGYQWSEFLLAGITRSFFSNDFRVIRTSNNSSEAHFDIVANTANDKPN